MRCQRRNSLAENHERQQSHLAVCGFRFAPSGDTALRNGVGRCWCWGLQRRQQGRHPVAQFEQRLQHDLVVGQLKYGPGRSWCGWPGLADRGVRSEEHTSELQSLMRISYAVFCLKKTKT